MFWEDLCGWLIWAVLGAASVLVAAALLTVLLAVCNMIQYAALVFRHRNDSKPPPIEELLRSIQDVAYRPVPGEEEEEGVDDDDGSERGRDSCAICVTPYEAGDACSLLPACAHMFHKPCVTKWLRKKNTCPLCRATVAAGQGDAEIMV